MIDPVTPTSIYCLHNSHKVLNTRVTHLMLMQITTSSVVHAYAQNLYKFTNRVPTNSRDFDPARYPA